MEKLFDLLLERVNDKTKQAAGLVSVMSRDDTRHYIKVRIWDLAEGTYGFHIGNYSSRQYKIVTRFNYVKPYVNFEFPSDMKNTDTAFITNEQNEVILVSDVSKTDGLKTLLKNETFKENDEIPQSEGIPRPPRLSDVWDTSEKEAENNKEISLEEQDMTLEGTVHTHIPGPDELNPEMRELPDYLLESQPLKTDIQSTDFDIQDCRGALDRQFEHFTPFSNQRDDYEWWKVENPVVLHELLLDFGVKIRNFFNAHVMMSYFKFGFLIAGIYQDTDGDSLLVFGFPSALCTEKKPFEDFSVWVRNRGDQGNPEGYWLIYYDPASKDLLTW